MSQIIKPVMLDETGQTTNTKLQNLINSLTSGDAAKVAKLLQIADALESVHSVNGLTGDVVLDATNIKLDKMNPNSTTIQQILASEQSAVTAAITTMTSTVTNSITRYEQAVIPVSFQTEVIERDDFMLSISTSTV